MSRRRSSIWPYRVWAFSADDPRVMEALKHGASEAQRRGLEVHAGHGLDYDTAATVAAIPQVIELNIGHFLIGEAIFVGLETAIRTMRARIDAVRPGA